nr:uncharacterized mitochondrial protein AtMg00820-like [Nicotiana tomentosiformis]
MSQVDEHNLPVLELHEASDKHQGSSGNNEAAQQPLATNPPTTQPTPETQPVFQSRDPNWIEAMHAEINALQDNNIWEIVSLPKGKKPFGCKWIYKVKYKATCEVERFKARLVAKGYSLQGGIYYQETFSPIVKMVTLRSILSIEAARS